MDSLVQGSYAGFANYRELLGNAVFRRAAANTLLFAAISVPLNMILSLGLAMLLNRNIPFRSGFRISYLLPLAIPAASVVLVWQAMFDLHGTVNGWLAHWGIEPTDWMESRAALGVVIVVYLWKNVGYNSGIILPAGH